MTVQVPRRRRGRHGGSPLSVAGRLSRGSSAGEGGGGATGRRAAAGEPASEAEASCGRLESFQVATATSSLLRSAAAGADGRVQRLAVARCRSSSASERSARRPAEAARRGRAFHCPGPLRSPLLRAAVYRAAAVPDRRRSRAGPWLRRPMQAPIPTAGRCGAGRCHAATGPDEAVAGELAQTTARAREEPRGCWRDNGHVLAAVGAEEFDAGSSAAVARGAEPPHGGTGQSTPDAAYELLAMADSASWSRSSRRAELDAAAPVGSPLPNGAEADAAQLLLDAGREEARTAGQRAGAGGLPGGTLQRQDDLRQPPGAPALQPLRRTAARRRPRTGPAQRRSRRAMWTSASTDRGAQARRGLRRGCPPAALARRGCRSRRTGARRRSRLASRAGSRSAISARPGGR